MLKNFIGQERKDERPPLKGKVEELVRLPLGEIRVIVEGTSVESSSRAKKKLHPSSSKRSTYRLSTKGTENGRTSHNFHG